jgi:fructan beta-fructosidase
MERQVQFYSSPNLKEWKLMSTYGPAGDTTGIWECPALFEVPVKDQPGKTKWVLMHSPAPYMQYFVGEFDGYSFTNDNSTAKVYRPDYGPDYYAAIVFNDLPAGHAPVSIGWVNNWNYANDLPTTPWKSAMSLPRALSARKINNEWVMLQEPVPSVQLLRDKSLVTGAMVVNDIKLLPVRNQQLEISCSFTVVQNNTAGVRLAKKGDKYIEIGYDARRMVLYIDRTKAGDQSFHPAFAKQNRYETILEPVNGKISLHIFYDKSIVEVYANEGEAVMTAQLFPAADENGVELFSIKGKTLFTNINCRLLKSVW